MDQDVIYIDDDERNAVRTFGAGNRPGFGPRPRTRTVVVPQGSRRPMVIQSGGGFVPTTGYPQPQVIYAQQPGGIAARLGMTTGELVDTGLQILAAIYPLPPPPVAQGDTSIDMENVVLYEKAIAVRDQRCDQFRALGTVALRALR